VVGGWGGEIRLPNGAIRRLRPDGTFGDMQLSAPFPRNGTVVAVTDIKPPAINRHTFLFLVYHPARGQT
jgi:CRP-like cAMP-binding protein